MALDWPTSERPPQGVYVLLVASVGVVFWSDGLEPAALVAISGLTGTLQSLFVGEPLAAPFARR